MENEKLIQDASVPILPPTAGNPDWDTQTRLGLRNSQTSLFVGVLATILGLNVPGLHALGWVAGSLLLSWAAVYAIIFVFFDQRFQAYALENSLPSWTRIWLPMLVNLQSFMGLSNEYFDRRKREIGDNFCCAGMLVMGGFKDIESAVLNPQARINRLGISPLNPTGLPNCDVPDGRLVFLLSLSDEGAGGDGSRAAFKGCMMAHCFGDAAKKRGKDDKVKKLYEKLAEDYLAMPHGLNGAFFETSSRGLQGFLVRFSHYVYLGLDPEDDALMNKLGAFFYNTNRGGSTPYYMWGFHKVWKCTAKVHEKVAEMAHIYEGAAAFEGFDDAAQPMTRFELAKLMVSIMSIAALLGPETIAMAALGKAVMPPYWKTTVSELSVPDLLDKTDLDDRDAVKRFLYEVARLWTPVSATHRVLTEPLTLTVAGRERTFPTRTRVVIPLSLAHTDNDFWGPTVYEFNPDRENLEDYFFAFQSVGPRYSAPEASWGRMCPGRFIAMDMLIEMMIVIGKARRGGSQP